MASEKWLWLAIVVALLIGLWIQGPYLGDPYAMEEDARSFYWWGRFDQPELFRNDPLEQGNVADLALGPIILIIYKPSPGYSLLFQLASPIFPPILFSKLLIFPLLLATVYYAYGISRKIAGPKTSFAVSLAVVLLNLASPTAIAVTGGLQRSFTFPLLLAIVYYLVERRFVATAVVLVLSGSIYPPIFVVGAATYGLALLRPQAGSGRQLVEWKQLPPLLIAGVLITLLLLPALTRQSASAAAAQTGETEGETYSLFEDPRFQAGGRRALFQYYPLVGRMGIATDGSNVLHITMLSIAAIATFLLRPVSLARFPKELKLLFVASVLCFFAAWAAALLTNSFLLYLPSRYTQASLPLFLVIYVVLNARETLQRATTWLHRRRRYTPLLITPFAVMGLLVALLAPDAARNTSLAAIFPTLRLALGILSVVLVLLSFYSALGKRADAETPPEARGISGRGWALVGGFVLIGALLYVNTFHAPFLRATATERELFQFLETLPQDSLLAGSPCSLNSVPIFAKRQILFSCEDPHPDAGVIQAGLEAYYASSPAEVRAFCSKYEVDYLLVNANDFHPQRIAGGDYFYEPHNSQLQPILSKRSVFALRDAAGDARLYETGHLYVVDCRELAE